MQASLRHLPQFRLTTVEGDPAEAAGIVLNGQYAVPPYGESIDITLTGSRYDSERSLIQKIKDKTYYAPGPAVLQKMIREYPNFMRGNPFAGHYYQDDDDLIRAIAEKASDDGSGSGDSAYRFKVSVLDKKTDRVHRFTAELPAATRFRSMGISDVQRIESRLKIAALTTRLSADPNALPELHVYEINMSDGQVVRDIKIPYMQDPLAGKDVRVQEIQELDFTAASDCLVYQLFVSDASPAPAPAPAPDTNAEGIATAQRLQPKERKLIVYRYSTGSAESVSLPDDHGAPAEHPLFRDGKYVVYAEKTDAALIVHRYGLAERKWDPELRVTKEQIGAFANQQIQFGTNRLYLLLAQTDVKPPAVAVVDSTNGRVVYRGTVVADGSKNVQKELQRKLQVFWINMVS